MSINLTEIRDNPDPTVIENLESMLVDAKAGKIKAIVSVTDRTDASVTTLLAGEKHRSFTLLGALMHAIHRINTEWIEDE